MTAMENYEFKDYVKLATREYLSEIGRKANEVLLTNTQRQAVHDYRDIISTDNLSDLMYEFQEVDRGEE